MYHFFLQKTSASKEYNKFDGEVYRNNPDSPGYDMVLIQICIFFHLYIVNHIDYNFHQNSVNKVTKQIHLPDLCK